MTKLYLTVLYKTKYSESQTLRSFVDLGFGDNKNNFFVVCDNSPESEATLSELKEFLHIENVEYVHTPENTALSKVYNTCLEKYSGFDFFIIFDQDSKINRSDFDSYLDKTVSENPGVNIFLPQIYSSGKLYSPERFWIFKGSHYKNLPAGIHKDKLYTAIMSGTCARISFLNENKIRFNEELSLYGTDALFFHHKEKLLEKIKTDFPESKIILYMPTFRTGVWSKKPFNPFEEKYGFVSAEFSEFLEKQNLVFLYKPHFIDLELGQKEELGRRFIFISDESYDEQYNFVGQIDILMTDYSSIYFDFIATKKPVILAPFDLEEYIVTSRAHYFDYSELEGAKAKNWQEFYKILEENSYVPVREETRKKFSEYVDGNSCERLWKEITK